MSDRYFSGFDTAQPEAEALTKAERAPDYRGGELTFGHLDDRTFEVLAWRLKREEVGPDRVRLMQGTGERGRDVVVYDGGRVDTILQCKLLGSRMTKPAVIRELLKVALHDVLDPTVLAADGVRYELWAPGGFTEPAEDLIRGWPATWDAEEVQELFDAVRGAYAAFAGLTWVGVVEQVLRDFPARLQPAAVGGHDVSVTVREAPSVHEDFFDVNWVASIDVVQSVLRDTMRGEGFRHVTEEDVRYLLDRVEAIASDRRHGTGFGFLLGVPDSLLAAMTRAEFLALLEGTMSASYQTVTLLTGVLARRVEEMVLQDERLRKVVRTRTALAVLRASLAKDALGGLTRLMPAGEVEMEGERFRVPEGLDLWGRIEHEAGQWWDDLRSVVDAGEPQGDDAVTDDGTESDASVLYRLYAHMEAECDAPDRQAFASRVVGDLRNASTLVHEVAERVGDLVPDDLLVVSDLRLFDAPGASMARFFDLYRAAPPNQPDGDE